MYSEEIQQEINHIQSDAFQLAEYIYMAMALVKGQRVCIAVAYKIDYCIKKAVQFSELLPEVEFTHINKVKVGELKESKKFNWVKRSSLQFSES